MIDLNDLKLDLINPKKDDIILGTFNLDVYDISEINQVYLMIKHCFPENTIILFPDAIKLNFEDKETAKTILKKQLENLE